MVHSVEYLTVSMSYLRKNYTALNCIVNFSLNLFIPEFIFYMQYYIYINNAFHSYCGSFSKYLQCTSLKKIMPPVDVK